MKQLENALKLKSDLDALRPLSKEDELRIMQKFRLDWNYHSNNLEGNSLTYGETKALLFFGITAQGRPFKDHLEMSGHDDAIKWVLDITKQDRPLNENFIRELHKLILKESYEVKAVSPEGKPTRKIIKLGQYKTSPNHIETVTGEIFRFATPEETPAMMTALLDWFKTQASKKDFNPVLIASEFHYRFIKIHPFDDGNGRTARILMNFILLQNGFPPVIIKTDDRHTYLNVLRQADAGIIQPFIEYMTVNLIHSLQIMIDGAQGKSIEEPDDIDKQISLLEKRLNSISQPIETTKNKNSLLEIIDKSVKPLTEKFLKKASKFNKFYERNDLVLAIDSSSFSLNNDASLEELNDQISSGVNTIKPHFTHFHFKYNGFENYNFTTFIEFNFGLFKYNVSDSEQSVVIEKLYTEQLDEEEMMSLINLEMKRHNDQIEKNISEIEKGK